MKDLIKLAELKNLLGYKDTRSAEKWCKEHNTPIMLIGKRKYVHSTMLENAFLNEMHQSILLNGQDHETADTIIQAIKADDKIELTKLIDAPIHDNQSSNFAEKKSYDTIINKYKAA